MLHLIQSTNIIICLLPAATAATVGRGPLTVMVGLMVMEATTTREKKNFNNCSIL